VKREEYNIRRFPFEYATKVPKLFTRRRFSMAENFDNYEEDLAFDLILNTIPSKDSIPTSILDLPPREFND
jgi:hypothetical protein